MLKRKNKKKTGFTLIELVIVLAVLAIIALIAIPNFTKVRTDSQKKADIQSAEQIKDIMLMAIADKTITPNIESYVITFDGNKKFSAITEVTTTTVDITNQDGLKSMLKDVKGAQVNGKSSFLVKVSGTGDSEGTVEVGYSNTAGTDFDEGKLTK